MHYTSNRHSKRALTMNHFKLIKYSVLTAGILFCGNLLAQSTFSCPNIQLACKAKQASDHCSKVSKSVCTASSTPAGWVFGPPDIIVSGPTSNSTVMAAVEKLKEKPNTGCSTLTPGPYTAIKTSGHGVHYAVYAPKAHEAVCAYVIANMPTDELTLLMYHGKDWTVKKYGKGTQWSASTSVDSYGCNKDCAFTEN
jgi:hypothetical protein